MEPPCWCCALWGVYTVGVRQDQGTDPGWLCEQCADSSPSACNRRHEREISAADS